MDKGPYHAPVAEKTGKPVKSVQPLTSGMCRPVYGRFVAVRAKHLERRKKREGDATSGANIGADPPTTDAPLGEKDSKNIHNKASLYHCTRRQDCLPYLVPHKRDGREWVEMPGNEPGSEGIHQKLLQA